MTNDMSERSAKDQGARLNRRTFLNQFVGGIIGTLGLGLTLKPSAALARARGIAADYEAGRVVLVDGWLLSQTEAIYLQSKTETLFR